MDFEARKSGFFPDIRIHVTHRAIVDASCRTSCCLAHAEGGPWTAGRDRPPAGRTMVRRTRRVRVQSPHIVHVPVSAAHACFGGKRGQVHVVIGVWAIVLRPSSRVAATVRAVALPVRARRPGGWRVRERPMSRSTRFRGGGGGGVLDTPGSGLGSPPPSPPYGFCSRTRRRSVPLLAPTDRIKGHSHALLRYIKVRDRSCL